MLDLDDLFGFQDLGAASRSVRVVLYVAVACALAWLFSIGVTADWWFVRLTRVVSAVMGFAALAAFALLQERSDAKQSCLGAGVAFFASIGLGFGAAVVLIVGEVTDSDRG
ncbi:MAG: hypothetical protein AAF937_05685 [Planctomycetota bacterium]